MMKSANSVLKGGLAAAVGMVVALTGCAAFAEDAPAKPVLRFGVDGTFKVVMFSDIQDDAAIDPRTLATMNSILDVEKPDFVMLAGDNSTSGIGSAAAFRKYVGQIAAPMETRRIPWAHVYGNHDEDHLAATKLTKALQQPVYEALPYCISQAGPDGIGGVGNYVLRVLASASESVVFSLWGIDSGKYLGDNRNWYKGDLKKAAILDNGLQGNYDYDFVKLTQIMWYWNTSLALEQQNGHKVPGLMFMHIPLPEHRLIGTNPTKTGMVGEKNEDECNSPINSGLFAAVLQRGDIRGVFAGHDHVNSYSGTYCGVQLGYDASVGFATYGLDGTADKDRLRGARVFVVSEKDPWAISTYMRYRTEVAK